MQFPTIIAIAWVLFLAYWWISAIGVKRNIRRRAWRWDAAVRILVAAAIIALARLPGGRAFFRPSDTANPIVGVAGLVLCLAGFALAIWARLHLGRNWGMPMSLKEGHELVTTGPYRYIRHPVYTGMILAILGSALATSLGWLAIFVWVLIYFVYSARTEEGLMLQQFPDQYAEYRKRTKFLIPFVI